MRRPARCALGLMTLCALAGTACQTTVTEGSHARPMPSKPIAPPPVPSDAQVSAMTFMMLSPKARDTTGNGRADLIVIETYLFAEPYPSPVFAPGEFVFELFPIGGAGEPGVKPVATWRFAGPAAESARIVAMAGACYRFSLSLLDNHGTDVLPFNAASLTARFEPADGRPPIKAGGVVTVQLWG